MCERNVAFEVFAHVDELSTLILDCPAPGLPTHRPRRTASHRDLVLCGGSFIVLTRVGE
jgi:hypothetical protein